MLTPQEVTGSEFEKAVFGGYDMASVDRFLEQVTQDYSTLYRENGILKNKMKVLVDKVEEYRSTEDAMRMALLSAEKTAKEITAKAVEQRDSVDAEVSARRAELLADVEAEVSLRREELQRELAAEEAALERAKRETAAYIEKLKAAVSAYVETLAHLYDFVEPMPEKAPQAETPVQETPKDEPAAEPMKEIVPEAPKADPISDSAVLNIAEIINRSFSSAEEPEKPAEAEESASSKPLNIDYDNLRFGRDFDRRK